MVTDKLSGTNSIVGPGSTNSVLPNSNSKPDNQSVGASAFESVLGQKLSGATDAGKATDVKIEGVKFSQHALERMTNRGISFKPEELMKLNEAVDKAAKKGSKESLVLMGENALIVSVKNRTVVTAMDREAMKENVFTNIDSTIIM